LQQFQDEYTSKVTADATNFTVRTYSSGSKLKLFDSLQSYWKLRRSSVDSSNIINSEEGEATTSTEVEFEVKIEVSNPIILGVLDQVLKEVAGKQVEAFERRCREVIIAAKNENNYKNNSSVITRSKDTSSKQHITKQQLLCDKDEAKEEEVPVLEGLN